MPSQSMLGAAFLLASVIQGQSVISVADFGAQPDAILRTDGAITAGTSVLTSAGGTFSPGDTGKYIQIIGAGSGGTTHPDGAIGAGSTTLTSISGTFARTDVGRSMIVMGAGSGGQNLNTRIAAFISSTSVALADRAISAAAGAVYFYGAMTLEGTIQSVQDAATVTVSTPAVASISNATYSYGTNYSGVFQQAVDAAGLAGGGTVLVPAATSCPAGAVCGYVIAATDQMTGHAPGAVKIRYNNVSLVGNDPQTNLFCRGAWGLYTNSYIYPGQTVTIRGTCLALGDDQGPNGAAGENLSNVTIARLRLYGMTDGNTYNKQFSPWSPPLTTTGDGWDETHKAIALWQPSSTFSNILIDSVYIQDFKGENIYSGGSTISGMVIQNSTMTNFNGDGISMLASDVRVLNNTIMNGSNAGIENSTSSTATSSVVALVRQLYQGNTISNFPLEAIVIVGTDSDVAAGTIQIINNTFDTIGQINAGSGGVAIALGAQVQNDPTQPPNNPPANVTIAGNTCHDCYTFVVLQTGGHSQVLNNKLVVDHYSSGELINLSFRMNDVVIANNSGDRTPEAVANDRRVAAVYNLHWANSTLPWTNVLIHDNTWNFPKSFHYQFITDSAGWNAVTSQNIVWQNETCTGCVYDVNHGIVFASVTPTIPPFGPVVRVQSSVGPFNLTLDASKEQDGAELTVVTTGTQPITFNPDGNIALSSPLTVPPGGVAFFRYSGPIGKFVLAQRPTTISANSNSTPQTAVVGNAFGNMPAATVLDSNSSPVAGIAVAFAAPASGASGVFANGMNTTTALTDAAGVATATTFSANTSVGGPYTVIATASGVAAPTYFSLTNLLPPVSITVQTSPAGRSFTVDNVAYTSSQAFQWTPSVSHAIGTTATQAGGVGTQFVFGGWSDSGAISHAISTPNAAATYTANFSTQYQLTTGVNPAQGGTITAGGWFNAGSGVPVQATPNAGYQFNGFAGDLAGTTNPQTVFLNAPSAVTANFMALQNITFGALTGKLLGAAPFAVSATASSGLAVTFNSQTTSVCTVSGATVSLVVVGVCTIQATQAGNNISAAATPINQSFQITIPAVMGSLLGSGTAGTSGVSLTTEGTSDWVHWGDTNLSRKAGVAAQLSTYTAIGGGTPIKYANDLRPLSWSDGTPTGVSSNNKNGLYISGIGQGFSITAPADRAVRTVILHLGGWSSGGTLTAHLSDSSAPDFTNTTAPVIGQYDRNYTLTYQAAGAGQTLLVTWTVVAGSGNVTLNAAALQGGGGTTTGSIVASTGTPQSATVSTAFTAALQATVKDSGGSAVSGVAVNFMAPANEASGTFPSGATATVVTNASGLAIAPTLTANATVGSYSVTASVAGVATAATFSLSNTAVPRVGSLQGNGTAANAAVNLTAEGSADWMHWGDGSLIRKAGVAAQLSTYSVVGGGSPTKYANDLRLLIWTDGAPTASSSNNRNGLYIAGAGKGFSITAPADTTVRTIILHAGGWNSSGTLTAHLSDGSALDFVDTTLAASGQYDRNYTLTYRAGAPGQTLTMTWKMTSGSGNVTLSAAALAVANGIYPASASTLFYLPLDGPAPIAPEGCSVVGGPAIASITDRFGNPMNAIHVGATGSPFDQFRIQCGNTKIAGSANRSFTVGYWIRMSQLPDNGVCSIGCGYRILTILSTNSDNGGCRKYAVAQIDNGGVADACQGGTNGNNGEFISTTANADSKWHNLLWVFDNLNKVLTLYIDGIQNGSAPLPDPPFLPSNSQSVAGAENGSFALNGDLDDFWIESHAWSSAEVAAFLKPSIP